MARRKRPRREATVITTLRLPESLRHWVKRLAEKNRRSISFVVIETLEMRRKFEEAKKPGT